MTWTTRQRSKLGPLAAIAAGEGPLVLLLHGVGLRAQAWASQIDALAMNAICRRSDSAKRAVQARADALDGQTVSDPSETLIRWLGQADSRARGVPSLAVLGRPAGL